MESSLRVSAVSATSKSEQNGCWILLTSLTLWSFDVSRLQVENFRVLADQCQTEMSRAVRLALWDYKPGAALTASCDKDVANTCPKVCAFLRMSF